MGTGSLGARGGTIRLLVVDAALVTITNEWRTCAGEIISAHRRCELR